MFCVANSKVRRDCDLPPVATNHSSFFSHDVLTIKTPTKITNGFYKEENGTLLYNSNYADSSLEPVWYPVPVCPRAADCN